MMHRTFTTAPTVEEIAALAEEALGTIPAELLQHVKGIAIQVQDFPEDDIVRDMGLDSPFDLLGLYQGVDLSRKSVLGVAIDMDHIFLYRRPLLDYWCDGDESLPDLVRHVLIHEIGHHFGLSDDDMEAIEGAK